MKKTLLIIAALFAFNASAEEVWEPVEGEQAEQIHDAVLNSIFDQDLSCKGTMTYYEDNLLINRDENFQLPKRDFISMLAIAQTVERNVTTDRIKQPALRLLYRTSPESSYYENINMEITTTDNDSRVQNVRIYTSRRSTIKKTVNEGTITDPVYKDTYVEAYRTGVYRCN